MFLPHSTACLTTAALDPGTDLDILGAIEIILSQKVNHLRTYTHLPYYIVSSFLGPSLTIPAEGGCKFGEMQRIALIEFNGPREREIIVDIELEKEMDEL